MTAPSTKDDNPAKASGTANSATKGAATTVAAASAPTAAAQIPPPAAIAETGSPEAATTAATASATDAKSNPVIEQFILCLANNKLEAYFDKKGEITKTLLGVLAELDKNPQLIELLRAPLRNANIRVIYIQYEYKLQTFIQPLLLLLQALGGNPQLQQIHFYEFSNYNFDLGINTNIGATLIQALLDAGITSLSRLSLFNCGLKPGVEKLLSLLLIANPKLTHVDLSCNDDLGDTQIAWLIEQHPHVTHWNLARCDISIGGADFGRIAGVLTQPACRIQVLNLEGNFELETRTDGFDRFIAALGVNRSMHQVDLTGCNLQGFINDDRCVALAAAVRTHPTLKTIRIPKVHYEYVRHCKAPIFTPVHK